MGSPDGEPGLAGPRPRALPRLPTLPDGGERHQGQRVSSARSRQKRDPVGRAASAPHVLASPCGMSTARLSAQLSSSPLHPAGAPGFSDLCAQLRAFAPVGRPLPPHPPSEIPSFQPAFQGSRTAPFCLTAAGPQLPSFL